MTIMTEGTYLPKKTLLIVLLSGMLLALLFSLGMRLYYERVTVIDVSDYVPDAGLVYEIEKQHFANNQLFIRGYIYQRDVVPDNPIFQVALKDLESGRFLKMPTYYFYYPDIPREHQLDPQYSRSGFESVSSCKRFDYQSGRYQIFLLYEDYGKKYIQDTEKVIY